MDNFLATFLRTILIALVLATVLGLIGLALLSRRLRRIHLVPGADFATTLQAVPFGLVVVLDLLDFGLDMFAAPLTWVILSRYNLQGLRAIAVVEDLIPFTGPIPTMSLAWIVVHALGLGRRPLEQPYVIDPNLIETDEVGPGRYAPRTGGRS